MGWADFPAMGVKGAALSTLIASFCSGWSLYIIPIFKNIKTRFSVLSFSYDKKMMLRQIRLAFPLVSKRV